MEVPSRATEVGELVNAALASLGPNTQGTTVVIEPGVLALDADPMLFERVVANLVDNALRHGVGMSVRVEAGAVADRVEIRVAAHGTGIRPADPDEDAVAPDGADDAEVNP
jgi:two-component system sensor histidine kinase KdpD